MENASRLYAILAIVFALAIVFGVLITMRYGGHVAASIIGDPHHCSGGSPGPGCGNG